mgnify:CR=1 FL=1
MLRKFRIQNKLLQKEIADYLGVSRNFISIIESGKSSLPREQWQKLVNNDQGWDTTALLEGGQPSDNSIRGNVTRIGNISGVTNSPTTVNNNGGGESADLMRVIEQQMEQINAQHEQIQNLTEIIKNLTAR